MRLLNWPGPKIVKRLNEPTYEWAYIKAFLEGESNDRAYHTYEDMFGAAPKIGSPYWLVRLAIYYGALQLGYERTKKKIPSIEAAMLSCVSKLNEKELRNNTVLMHHVRAHDFEDNSFGGRELVV
jgi:hypothetical protein